MLQSCLVHNVIEAGTDEAGRGPLAGSVFAAAVILPQDFQSEQLNDSKKLTPKQRLQLRPIIQQHAVAWAVAQVTPQEIDQLNILNASILAMHRALQQLSVQPQHIIVDGNRFKPYIADSGMAVPYQTIVKGDGKYMSIAAASILAKTYRDDYMLQLHQQYPQYGWDKNMGYPTAQHRMAILKYGLTPFHRQSFSFRTDDLPPF